MRLAAPAPAAERPLSLVELPVPRPGHGEVLLRVRACGVCRTDLHILEGELPPHRSPVVPGHQIVGEVVGFGEGAAEVSPGGEAGAAPLTLGERVGVPWLHKTCGRLPLLPQRPREPLRERHLHRLGRGRRLRRVHGGAGRLGLSVAGRHDRSGDRAASLRRHHRLPLPAAPGGGRRRRRPAGHGRRRGWCRRRGARPLARSARGPARRRPGAPPRHLRLRLGGLALHAGRRLARLGGVRFTRDDEHRDLAIELGAAWAGETSEDPGVLLDAAVVFAPAGELAASALRHLDKGGIVALGGIYSSPIPSIEYPWIYHERVLRSVANSTRRDARELLRDAALVPVVSRVRSTTSSRPTRRCSTSRRTGCAARPCYASPPV